MTAPDDLAGAAPVRDEDAFDVVAVANWLRDNAVDPTGLDGIPRVGQYTGGASNLTYVLRYAARDLILRRPPVGTKARGAHDMRREHFIQSSLAPVFPAVPRMVAFCDDQAVVGSDFYVMERLSGHILRRSVPPELGLDLAGVDALCRNAIDTLVALHRVDAQASGLTVLGKGEGYVHRQVEGWSTRYRAARTPDVPDFEAVMAWLAEHEPADVGQVVIHNDFRLDNLVLSAHDPTKVIGVLDWEMATIGDPLMDLGSALAYWVQPDDDATFVAQRRQPTNAPGMWTRAQVVAHYTEAMGLAVTPGQWRFYEVFGLFRLAVIAQQIYYRFVAGQTTNPVFAAFGQIVAYLEERCARALAAG